MAQVLLAAKAWEVRTLLRAQLIEEGLEVMAYETVGEALEAANQPGLLPELLVADLTASDDPADELDQLAAWAKQIPIWVIASRTTTTARTIEERNFERVLFRPLDLGQVVLQIEARLGM